MLSPSIHHEYSHQVGAGAGVVGACGREPRRRRRPHGRQGLDRGSCGAPRVCCLCPGLSLYLFITLLILLYHSRGPSNDYSLLIITTLYYSRGASHSLCVTLHYSRGARRRSRKPWCSARPLPLPRCQRERHRDREHERERQTEAESEKNTEPESERARDIQRQRVRLRASLPPVILRGARHRSRKPRCSARLLLLPRYQPARYEIL